MPNAIEVYIHRYDWLLEMDRLDNSYCRIVAHFVVLFGELKFLILRVENIGM